jgi:hypothetical protein
MAAARSCPLVIALPYRRRMSSPGVRPLPNFDARRCYDDLMTTSFAPALRRAGLRGSRGRFELPSTSHWAQLGFQHSASNDLENLEFTVNLSVISREVWTGRAAANASLGRRPSPGVWYGPWADQVRVGAVPGHGVAGIWWRLSLDVDQAVVRDEVVDALVDLGVPWLRKRI